MLKFFDGHVAVIFPILRKIVFSYHIFIKVFQLNYERLEFVESGFAGFCITCRIPRGYDKVNFNYIYN